VRLPISADESESEGTLGMRSLDPAKCIVATALCVLLLTSVGCNRAYLARLYYQPPSAPMPLGTLSDDLWKKQEAAAEASDFVIYQHEFDRQGTRLNLAGEDHVKQIAARLAEGQDFPVIIERSMTTPRQDTKYRYPVHANPELDLRRRDVVVRLLNAMGVPEAEPRVVVAPALAPGMVATEAEAAYLESIGDTGDFNGVGGFGGFGGGIGGFGF